MDKNLKLKGYRSMLDLTQEQMANKLNITGRSYIDKELGKKHFKYKEMLAIKEMVKEIKPDVTIDELFFN
jgi:transcriptional regulator, putative